MIFEHDELPDPQQVLEAAGLARHATRLAATLLARTLAQATVPRSALKIDPLSSQERCKQIQLPSMTDSHIHQLDHVVEC